MRILVTRPASQAADWVLDLQAHGLDAVALPLIAIVAVEEPSTLPAAWQNLGQRRLVVFVSPNAVQHFFAKRPAGTGWPASTWAGSPGPGTTRALVALGVPLAQIVEPAADAPQFDSEALWAQLQAHDWRGADVLMVRGEGGRDWLADTLRRHGAKVAHVAAYGRSAPHFDAAERVLLQAALAAPTAHLWLFSSSEAIAQLEELVPPGVDWARTQAVGTHPRIVERARQAGFVQAVEARPSLASVVACIQSIRP